ncbi:MAG: hypothetical protein H6732_14490 [Alphaproteobacteria bacterium]|nr:hypothetical protein [Alphaproteobacteria bacterium]
MPIRRSSLLLLAATGLLVACTPDGGEPTKPGDDSDGTADDDTSPGDDRDDTGAGPDSSDTADSSDTSDTGDTGDSAAPVTPVACHPLDPLEAVATAWVRTYQLQVEDGAKTGTETHTAGGVQPVPTQLEATAKANGRPLYANTTVVKTSGAAGISTTTRWLGCDGAQDPSALELAETVERGSHTTHSMARSDSPYLPTEGETRASFQPNWTHEVAHRVRWPGGPGCGIRSATRVIQSQHAGLGWEQVTTPGTGTIDAWHLSLLVDQTFAEDASFPNPLCLVSATFYEDFFGVGTYNPADGGFVRLKSDQWWVPGLGMVKEVVVDADASSTVLEERVLTSCTGLPGCL